MESRMGTSKNSPGERSANRMRWSGMMGQAGCAVGQMGFYDLDKRLDAISARGDPLEVINATVPFESFRHEIEAVVRLAPEARKSNAGRKPYEAVLMFKILVLQTLSNRADEQLEYLIRDRLSFMRFLGLGLEGGVPDATTVWLFREGLAKAGLVRKPF